MQQLMILLQELWKPAAKLTATTMATSMQKVSLADTVDAITNGYALTSGGRKRHGDRKPD